MCRARGSWHSRRHGCVSCAVCTASIAAIFVLAFGILRRVAALREREAKRRPRARPGAEGSKLEQWISRRYLQLIPRTVRVR